MTLASSNPQPKFGEVWLWDNGVSDPPPRMVISPASEFGTGAFTIMYLTPGHFEVTTSYWPPHTFGTGGTWKRLRAADE